MLEDAGYFCVDNLPVPLISKFAEIAYGESSAMEKVALGIDIRNGEGLELMGEALRASHILKLIMRFFIWNVMIRCL